uniref:G-protein coupled receptors family 3 profile domain-containing protein n=1 Tax=Glossina brevipalpis TaxID=37001 RepID=A0A1A9WYC5_9MUSC
MLSLSDPSGLQRAFIIFITFSWCPINTEIAKNKLYSNKWRHSVRSLGFNNDKIMPSKYGISDFVGNTFSKDHDTAMLLVDVGRTALEMKLSETHNYKKENAFNSKSLNSDVSTQRFQITNLQLNVSHLCSKELKGRLSKEFVKRRISRNANTNQNYNQDTNFATSTEAVYALKNQTVLNTRTGHLFEESHALQRNAPNQRTNEATEADILSVYLPGDLIIGGLFPVHEKGEGSPCGVKVYNRGVQRLEAMLYAVDRINNDQSILPNITLGVHILDTCSRETYALNQSLQFVRASLNQNLDTSAFECSNNEKPHLRKDASAGPVFGVIGGSYSSVSLQVANLLRLFHIPQISPASTAKTLSDKTRFDLFARTVPPDTFQSETLVDIVKALNWTYVSTIHSEGSYGEYGIEAFHREAINRQVCIAAAEKVPSNADEKIFDTIIQKLSKKSTARGVVLFTRAEDARRILLAAKRAKLSQPFHWVASDGWGKQTRLLDGLEDIAEGSITVELQSEYIEDFDRYMKALTPETNKRNPWFNEYWQATFNCILSDDLSNNHIMKRCDKNDRLSEKVGYQQESKIQFVIDAAYAFAYALDNLRKDVCVTAANQNDQSAASLFYNSSSSSGWLRKTISSNSFSCHAMEIYDGKDFYNNYLLNISFIDLAGSQVKFDRQGDGLARYDVLNYQRVEPNSSSYYYKIVGKWFNSLELNINQIVWNGNAGQPISACSLPCGVGMIRKQQGDTCCWVCDKCESYEYVHDEFTCLDCGPGYLPYRNKTSCYALPIEYLRWNSLFGLVPMIIAIFGICMTLAVITLFIKNNDTPLVRASGRELSYMLLAGILVCYSNTFVLVAKPTIVSCVLQRFGVGVGFSIIYSALLTKTNRIARIFHSASKSAIRLRFISPKTQVVITASLIGIQVLITLIWMIVEAPGTRYYYSDRTMVILKCKMQDNSFLISQIYNMILITVCTLYAIKTRKIPENFNESKFIGFTMYTTCIIWLAFVPIYFGTGNSYEIQTTTLSVAISLSSSVALICLYTPKVYILVFHPDKNIRKLTMNSHAYNRAPVANASIGADAAGWKVSSVITDYQTSTLKTTSMKPSNTINGNKNGNITADMVTAKTTYFNECATSADTYGVKRDRDSNKSQPSVTLNFNIVSSAYSLKASSTVWSINDLNQRVNAQSEWNGLEAIKSNKVDNNPPIKLPEQRTLHDHQTDESNINNLRIAAPIVSTLTTKCSHVICDPDAYDKAGASTQQVHFKSDTNEFYFKFPSGSKNTNENCFERDCSCHIPLLSTTISTLRDKSETESDAD